MIDWNTKAFKAAWIAFRGGLDDTKSFLADVLGAYEGAKWQPIETAPRDGTAILVYAPEYRHLRATIIQCCYHDDKWFEVFDFRDVTHWQPLPPQPTKSPLV